MWNNMSPLPRCVHTGVALGEACTIVLRGASSHILEEADRSLHDALCVLAETVKEPRVLYGGGWPEMRMARAIEEAAKKMPGAVACAPSLLPCLVCGSPSDVHPILPLPSCAELNTWTPSCIS
jgi:TCP-1/cpn60 chaperonin family